MKTNDILSLTGAYVLNALDADERKAFEAELAHSEAARIEVAELADTAILLGLAVTPIAPSAANKTRIMAQLSSTVQLEAEPEAHIFDVIHSPATKSETVAQLKWFRRPTTLLSAAAVAASLIVGTVVTGEFQNSLPQIAQANTLAAISMAPDSHRVFTQFDDGGGDATVMWSNEVGHAALLTDTLPVLDEGVYQVWYVNEAGEARDAGLLPVKADTTSWTVLDNKMNTGDSVAVTVESSKSAQPTSNPILTVSTVGCFL